ncbi:MAG: protein kinase [Polyangiaceae bacterium]|nr:protein kinase [Polyangiaceae bacterium]
MLEVGQLFDGKYRIVRALGSGGMGTVYEAENERIQRRVAVKVLRRELAADATSVARFQQEAVVASRVGSPHIVEVIDAGVAEGAPYMVLELLTGEPLSSRVAREGSLTPDRALPLALQVLDGLAAAHASGVVHRDLKPENIWVCDRGPTPEFVKLLDFGVCKVGGGLENLRMTRTGMAIGTPMYMAPEQARGDKDVDARVDVYAAGVLLYELLTGRAPFSGASVHEVLFDVVLKEPPDLRELVPHLDRGLVLIVQRAMAKRADDRWPSAEALAAALRAWRGGASVAALSLPGSSSRRSWRVDGAGAAAQVPPRGPATVPVPAFSAGPGFVDAPTVAHAPPAATSASGPRATAPPTEVSPAHTPRAVAPEIAPSPRSRSVEDDVRPRFAGYTAPSPRAPVVALAVVGLIALLGAAVGGVYALTRPPPPDDEEVSSASATASVDEPPPMPSATAIVSAAPKASHAPAPLARPRATAHGPRIRETMDLPDRSPPPGPARPRARGQRQQ